MNTSYLSQPNIKTSPPYQDKPSQHPSPPPTHHPIFITVFDHPGAPLPGLTRTFMRHSGLAIQNPPHPPANNSSPTFSIHHITGTPGIGMTYHHIASSPDPRDTEPTLLCMIPLGSISGPDMEGLESVLRGVEVRVEWGWNCQDWVRSAVRAMVEKGFVGEEEGREGIRWQREVIQGGVGLLRYGGD